MRFWRRCEHKWKYADVVGIKFRYCEKCGRVERLEPPSFIDWIFGRTDFVWKKYDIDIGELLEYVREDLKWR